MAATPLQTAAEEFLTFLFNGTKIHALGMRAVGEKSSHSRRLSGGTTALERVLGLHVGAEGATQEARNMPGVEVLVGRFAKRIVTTRQRFHERVETATFELVGDLLGEFGQEREVVLAVNHQRLLRPS